MDISGVNLQSIQIVIPPASGGGGTNTPGPLELRNGRNGATSYVGGPTGNSFTITSGNVISVSVDSVTAGNVWANSVLGDSNQSYGFAAYGNGTYVLLNGLVDSGDNIAISTNGYNWQLSPAPGLGANRGGAIVYGDKFVRLQGLFGSPSSTIWYSTDGTNWTSADVGLVSYWRDVAYGGGRYVAVSESSQTQAVTSGDGITWNTVSMPATAQWTSVTYAAGRFVAIGNNGNRAAYSTDGNTWTGATLPANTNWIDVAYGNGTFLAVAVNGNTTWSRDNGQTWANGLPNGGVGPWDGNSFFQRSLAGGSDILVITNTSVQPPITWYSADGGNNWANVYREVLPF